MSRDRTVGETFYILFTTRAFATGIPTQLAGTPVVSAYEDNSTTQITAGITLGVDHDSVTGLNLITVVATGANGYEAGKDYSFVITTGTVGGVSVVGEVVGEFSLGLDAAFTRLGAAGAGLSAVPWNAAWDAEVQSEVNDALVALGLDHLVAAAVVGADITDDSIIAMLVSASATADWDDYVNTTDALQAIRDRGDAAWITGGGGADPALLQNTTINTLASQTSFTLVAGSADNDAYNSMIAVITDQTTGVQKAVATILDYVGSSKTITLAIDPGIFVMAAGDTIDILAVNTKANWQELLTGATHNIATSAGRRLRQSTGIVMSDDTAQAGGANTITLAAGESATDGLYKQAFIAIVGGAGAGQGHHINAYDGTTKIAVIDDTWAINPDATSEYVIYGAGSHDSIEEGVAAAGGATSITLDAFAPATDDVLNGNIVTIVSGIGSGQTRRITAYNGTTKVATVVPAWETNPDSTSAYWVVADEITELVNAVLDEVNTGAAHNVTNSLGKQIRESAAVLILATGTAQAGAAGTITLAAGADANDNFYNDLRVVIVGGTGIGQARLIHDYNGTTKVATTTPNWVVTPDATSEYQIQSQSNTHVHELETAALAQVNAECDTAISDAALATAAALATVDTNVSAILVDTASMGITKNAIFNDFEFPMVLTSDHYTAATGKTVTGEMSIDGAAFAAVNGTIAEVGSGVYQIDLTADDTNGDVITYKFSATDCDDTIITVTTRA